MSEFNDNASAILQSLCFSILLFIFLDSFILISFFSINVLFDLILYVPSTIFQLNRDGSSWVEPVLS